MTSDLRLACGSRIPHKRPLLQSTQEMLVLWAGSGGAKNGINTEYSFKAGLIAFADASDMEKWEKEKNVTMTFKIFDRVRWSCH